MAFWVTSPGKPSRNAKMIAEFDKNLEWIVEEGEDKYHMCSQTNSGGDSGSLSHYLLSSKSVLCKRNPQGSCS